MARPLISKRLALLSAITLLILGGTGQFYPAFAADAARFSSADPKIRQLGINFMQDIGGKLQQSDLFLSGAGKPELAEQKSGSTLPDNEPLLLRASIGKDHISVGQDIYAIKRKNRLMLSLGDFALATGLAIKVNAAEQTASGWFIRESQTFALDVKKNEVVISGKAYPGRPGDMEATGNDIMVAADAVERWLGVSFDYDFSNLVLLIQTAQPFPLEEAYLRSKKRGGGTYAKEDPVLPYRETPYGLISLPYIDTELNGTLTHSPGNEVRKTADFSTIAAGDIAGFNTRLYVSGTKDEPYVNSVRATMGRADVDGNLLGPLHATSYQFGDVTSESQPLIGGGAQEQGVKVSNRNLLNLTTDTQTQIMGDAQPGWDVELYRNDVFIKMIRVDNTGRYDFGNVDIVLGDNDFRLIFYGPQGEQREEHRHVGVNPDQIANNTGHYTASLTRNGVTTWNSTKQNSSTYGDPHLNAVYEYGIRGFGSVSAGLNTTSLAAYDLNQRLVVRDKTYLRGGVASYFLDSFFNTDIGYDPETGGMGWIFTARHLFGKQAALFRYNRNTEGFAPNRIFGQASEKDSYRASLSGPIPGNFDILKQTNYSLEGSYSENYNGGSTLTAAGSLNTRVKSILFTTGLQYALNNSADGNGSMSLSGTSSIRGFFLGGLWLAQTDYRLQPERGIDQHRVQYSRQIKDNLDSVSEIKFDPNSRIVTGSVGLNWRTQQAIISPRVQYDTHQNATIGLNVHIGAGADPFNKDYALSAKYLTGTGGVAARIFRDANGNGVFDDGDELLPDAEIKAVQSQRSGFSDETGVAFIPDLEQNRLTDVIINPGAGGDAYALSLFEGVSIRPHPGAVTKLEFPIVTGGETDGQAGFVDSQGTAQVARNMTLKLVAPNGKVEKSVVVAGDGYWSMSSVRPGIYYLTAETDESNPGYFTPRLLEYKPDGTILYGQDVKLSKGHTTNFKFTAENSPPDGQNHARVIRPSDIASQRILLEAGAFHSRLAMTLAWYKIKLAGKIPGGVTLAVPLAELPFDKKTGLSSLILRPNAIASIGQGAAACQDLGELRLGACSVNVITTYRAPQDEKIVAYTPPAKIAQKETETDFESRVEEHVAIAQPVEPVMPVAMNAAPDAQSDSQPNAGPVAALAKPSEDVKIATTTTAALSPALAADLADYVAVNPSLNRDVLKEKAILLNLGSYNSRALMTVIWFKIRTRYAAMIGDAKLLVQPTDSNASLQTGKYTLRVSLPVFNVEDANNRCSMLTAEGQECSVEILPAGLQASR